MKNIKQIEEKKKRFVIECRQIFSHLFAMSIPKTTSTTFHQYILVTLMLGKWVSILVVVSGSIAQCRKALVNG